MKRVCVVTSAHISYNPRLVKDADALAEAGYNVRAVATNVEADKWQLDRALMAGREWKLDAVTAYRNGPRRGRWFRAALRQKWCMRATQLFPHDRCVMRASTRYGMELAQLAAREPADLFIAYKLQVLPVAASAAKRWKAKLGFDVEDFHSGMRRFGATKTHADELAERVEAEYLPRCDYLTAASPGVASAVSKRYGGQTPISILNVFPLAERPPKPPVRMAGSPLRLHWFSHVIGADRGLEDAVRAMQLLPAGSVELHLRGQCDATVRGYLDGLISEAGIDKRAVIIHATVPPNELVCRTASFDVGLALETPVSDNRIICMKDLCTNKVFTYLLAGLAIAASGAGETGRIYDGAGFSYPSGDVTRLATGLKHWLDKPDELSVAKKKAWELGESRYNWDLEKEKLLSAVGAVLST